MGRGRPRTNREEEVIALLCEGLVNKEIGARLHIAETTVKNHLGNVYRKHGFYGQGSRVRLVMELLRKKKSVAPA
jgi:DNA-binding NarL/FixJ family response regulator